MDIVNILNVLGAGIAFLLAFLSYKIIEKLVAAEQRDDQMINLAKFYMWFAFALGISAMATQLFSSFNSGDSARSNTPETLSLNASKVTLSETDTGFTFRYPGAVYRKCPDGAVVIGVSNMTKASDETNNIDGITFICASLEVALEPVAKDDE